MNVHQSQHAGSAISPLFSPAGGGMNHGQVFGSTDSKGYDIASRRVRPQDLAATVYHHLGIDTKTHWPAPDGRPMPIVTEGGQVISELL